MKPFLLLRSLSGNLTRTLAPHSHRFLSSATAPSTFSLKNVTKSNFESSLADLRRHVRDADFVAIDLEMTGVASAPWRECVEFDRFDVQYLKVKDSAEKFAVVQFGVCPFRWDSSRLCFVAHPWVLRSVWLGKVIGTKKNPKFYYIFVSSGCRLIN